jgi:hypothetical protein
MQFMHLELQRKTNWLNAAMALLEFLRSQPDQEAAELLARLRLGESIESLIRLYVPNGQSPEADAAVTVPFSVPQHGLTYPVILPFNDNSFRSPSSAFSESAVSPSLLSPSLSSPLMLRSASTPSSTFDYNAMQMNALPEVDESADSEEVARLRAEAARLRKGRTGFPQITFGGITWDERK